MNHCDCGDLDAGIKVFSHILSCGYAKPRFALLSSRSSSGAINVPVAIIPIVFKVWTRDQACFRLFLCV